MYAQVDFGVSINNHFDSNGIYCLISLSDFKNNRGLSIAKFPRAQSSEVTRKMESVILPNYRMSDWFRAMISKSGMFKPYNFSCLLNPLPHKYSF